MVSIEGRRGDDRAWRERAWVLVPFVALVGQVALVIIYCHFRSVVESVIVIVDLNHR